jgi:hypothetical protein
VNLHPHSTHRICQRIRNMRNELNAEEKWARAVEHQETRKVLLEQVFLWRKAMDYLETLIVERGDRA